MSTNTRTQWTDEEVEAAATLLAKIGDWALVHSQAIRAALERTQVHQPIGKISPYERALDSMPAELK